MVSRAKALTGLASIVMILLLAVSGFSGHLVSSGYSTSAVNVLSSQSGSATLSYRTLTSPNAQLGGGFGSSVAISGNFAIIGAPTENADGHSEAGHAYIFDGLQTIKKITTLTSPNAQYSGNFGESVAISGKIAVVGAFNENVNGHQGAGHAYIFNVTTGMLLATLTSPHAQDEGGFGGSVAINGNIVVVGDEEMCTCRAYVFEATTGTLVRTLSDPNPEKFDFGSSVAISGDVVVVGSLDTCCVSYRAYVFNASSGELIHTLTSPNSGLGFAYSVAISGKTIVVGSYLESVSGYQQAGRAYIFHGLKTIESVVTLSSPHPQAYGAFGWSVGVSGNLVVVGTCTESIHSSDAYIYNATTGKVIQTLSSPVQSGNCDFGSSVAVSGSNVIVGAPDETASGYGSAGHAYIFFE